MNQEDVLAFIRANPGATYPEIVKKCSNSSLGYKLAQLRKYKLIERRSNPTPTDNKPRIVRYYALPVESPSSDFSPRHRQNVGA